MDAHRTHICVYLCCCRIIIIACTSSVEMHVTDDMLEKSVVMDIVCIQYAHLPNKIFMMYGNVRVHGHEIL